MDDETIESEVEEEETDSYEASEEEDAGQPARKRLKPRKRKRRRGRGRSKKKDKDAGKETEPLRGASRVGLAVPVEEHPAQGEPEEEADRDQEEIEVDIMRHKSPEEMESLTVVEQSDSEEALNESYFEVQAQDELDAPEISAEEEEAPAALSQGAAQDESEEEGLNCLDVPDLPAERPAEQASAEEEIEEEGAPELPEEPGQAEEEKEEEEARPAATAVFLEADNLEGLEPPDIPGFEAELKKKKKPPKIEEEKERKPLRVKGLKQKIAQDSKRAKFKRKKRIAKIGSLLKAKQGKLKKGRPLRANPRPGLAIMGLSNPRQSTRRSALKARRMG